VSRVRIPKSDSNTRRRALQFSRRPRNSQRISGVGYALGAIPDTRNVPQKSCGCWWKSSDVPGASEDSK
jgi:hypothetical protein